MTTRRQFLLGAGALAIAPSLPALPAPSRITYKGVPIVFDDEPIDLRAEKMLILNAEFNRDLLVEFDRVYRESFALIERCIFIEDAPST